MQDPVRRAQVLAKIRKTNRRRGENLCTCYLYYFSHSVSACFGTVRWQDAEIFEAANPARDDSENLLPQYMPINPPTYLATCCNLQFSARKLLGPFGGGAKLVQETSPSLARSTVVRKICACSDNNAVRLPDF
jgi:hypothetical protein